MLFKATKGACRISPFTAINYTKIIKKSLQKFW